jgi:hypothetical protein
VVRSDSTKPSLEQKIAKFERDPEYFESIKRDKTDDKRRNQLIQKFRLGAKRLCAQSFWSKFEREIQTNDATELSNALQIRREEIYKLRRGEMSLEMLVALISEVGWDCADLDPLPALRDRAVAGYQLALYWLKTEKAKPKEEDLISEEDLIATFLVLTDKGFRELRKGRRQDQWTDEEWNNIAIRVRPKLAKHLAVNIKDLSHQSGQDFRTLEDKWAREVAECRRHVPDRCF